MKKYLAVALCVTFLLGNPVEAAVAHSLNKEGKVDSYLALAAKKSTQNSKLNSGNRNKIKGQEQEQEKKTTRYSSGDLELLARLVHAEAKGEPYQGKIAVAATVLNRVGDPDFPDTIPDVIYEYNQGFQYCPVRNGEINYPADKQAVKAVEEALAGKDPTAGALSFFNPDKSSNTWILNRPYSIKIGNHIFVK